MTYAEYLLFSVVVNHKDMDKKDLLHLFLIQVQVL